jgi:transposase
MSHQEMDRLEIVTKVVGSELVAAEAAEQLGLSVRQVKRLKKRFREDGATSLIHRGRGQPSKRKLKPAFVNKIITTIKKFYPDFGPTLACEKLFKKHQIKVSKETVRKIMTANNLWKTKPNKRNHQHRAWRPRKEHYGSLEQYDGCYHHWFEDRSGEYCLLLSVDDATGKITQARFEDHEGVIPTFRFWKRYIEHHGKPTAIYLDKFSTYKINHPSAKDNYDLITQFQRACQDLGIQLISAHSPEAKGRVERMFKTLQDRLVKELRLAGISDPETANTFLEEKFIPEFNVQFSVIPEKTTDFHRSLTEYDQKNIDSIFSLHSQRTVMNDFTIQFKNQYFQLDQQQPLTVCRKETIRVEERLDGIIILRLRDKELAYHRLPKRPEKERVLKIPALTTSKPTYRPPADHPWRKQFFRNNMNVKK